MADATSGVITPPGEVKVAVSLSSDGAVAEPPLPEKVPLLPNVQAGKGLTLHPTTTEAEDQVTAGQRRINLIWESTQSAIAILVTGITVYVLARVSVSLSDVTSNQLIAAMQLNVMATLILSFYFSRTNHAAIGGIGRKPEMEEYRGR